MTSYFNSFYYDSAAAIWAGRQHSHRHRHQQQQQQPSNAATGGCKTDDVTRTGLAMMAAAHAAAQQYNYNHNGPIDWSLRVAADCNRLCRDVTMTSSSATTAYSGLVDNISSCGGGGQYNYNSWPSTVPYRMHPYRTMPFEIGGCVTSLPVDLRDSPLSAVESTPLSDGDTTGYRSSMSQPSTCGIPTSADAATTGNQAPAYPWMNIVGKRACCLRNNSLLFT